MRYTELSESPIFTPAFWAWFKKSKVVDADGKPLRVYHGTRSDFKEFSYGHTTGSELIGSGFYFTTNPGEALIYSGIEDGARTIPVYLSIQKPLDANKVGSMTAAQVAKIIEKSPVLDDALSNWGDVDYQGYNKVFRTACDAYAFKNGNIVKRLFNLANDFFDGHEEAFNRALYEVYGYDGVVSRTGNGAGTHWVAWFPNQIKSVGNLGTFSATSNDIAESELDEAPLGDFAVYGDTENPGSYQSNDMKAIQNPKWLKKVESHFSRSPFKFNVYLYNAPNGDFKVGDEVSKSFAKYYQGRLIRTDIEHINSLFGTDFKRDRNGITMIMTDNEGDDKFGLTPWILAHRFAHALIFINRRDQMSDHAYNIRLLLAPLQNILHAAKRLGSLGDVFKFKSAKNGVAREGEYLVELITQYIVQGSITVNIPEVVAPDPKSWGLNSKDPIQAKALRILRSMNKRYEKDPYGWSFDWVKELVYRGLTKDIDDRDERHYMYEVVNDEESPVFLAAQEVWKYFDKLNAVMQIKGAVKNANERVEDLLKTCVDEVFILGT